VDFFDTSFWQSFVSNLLATSIGVGLGIPVALLINRWVEAKIEKERKGKIIRVISDEVLHNWGTIRSWLNDPKRVNVWILFSQLKDESWQALSDGGDLEPIQDPYLIKDLAEAYSYVHSLMLMSEKYFDLLYFSGENAPGYVISNMWQRIVDKAKEADNYLIDLTKDFGAISNEEPEFEEIIGS